jgi:hypothetical protein
VSGKHKLSHQLTRLQCIYRVLLTVSCLRLNSNCDKDRFIRAFLPQNLNSYLYHNMNTFMDRFVPARHGRNWNFQNYFKWTLFCDVAFAQGIFGSCPYPSPTKCPEYCIEISWVLSLIVFSLQEIIMHGQIIMREWEQLCNTLYNNNNNNNCTAYSTCIWYLRGTSMMGPSI